MKANQRLFVTAADFRSCQVGRLIDDACCCRTDASGTTNLVECSHNVPEVFDDYVSRTRCAALARLWSWDMDGFRWQFLRGRGIIELKP